MRRCETLTVHHTPIEISSAWSEPIVFFGRFTDVTATLDNGEVITGRLLRGRVAGWAIVHDGTNVMLVEPGERGGILGDLLNMNWFNQDFRLRAMAHERIMVPIERAVSELQPTE